jgi:single-strand DNA-binding protein
MTDTSTVIVGNLTDDPELRFTQGGAPVCNFRVAVTPRRPDGKGGWEDGDTSFYQVVAWRSLAENVAESLSKGARVLVYGTLRQRSWETPEGERRSVVEVQADEVGPSLRWATAKPERTRAKAAGGGRKGGQFDDEPPF